MQPVKISNILKPILEGTQRDLASLLKQLQVGQVLNARVLARIQPGLLRLQVGGNELTARSQVDMNAGSRVRLEVIKPGPLPELRVLRATTIRDLQNQLVRTALARQLPPAEVRQQLATLRDLAAGGRQETLVRQFSEILSRAGLDARRTDASRLRAAVTNSGVLHEARMASRSPALSSDTKTALLRLMPLVEASLQKARNLPPEAAAASPRGPAPADTLLTRLLRLLEGSVQRIQLQQGTTVPVDESPRQAWQFDLPMLLPDEVHDAMMRIEREPDPDDPAESTWSVNLAFDFDNIGLLQCRLTISGERLSVSFWCERDETHQLVEQRLDSLQQALEQQGLTVVHMTSLHGEPPQPLISVPRPVGLFDGHA